MTAHHAEGEKTEASNAGDGIQGMASAPRKAHAMYFGGRFLNHFLSDRTYLGHFIGYNLFNVVGATLTTLAYFCTKESFVWRLVAAMLAILYWQFWTQLRASAETLLLPVSRIPEPSSFMDSPIGRIAQIQRFLKRLASARRLVVELIPGHCGQERDPFFESKLPYPCGSHKHARRVFSENDLMVLDLRERLPDKDGGGVVLDFHLTKARLCKTWWCIFREKPDPSKCIGWTCLADAAMNDIMEGADNGTECTLILTFKDFMSDLRKTKGGEKVAYSGSSHEIMVNAVVLDNASFSFQVHNQAAAREALDLWKQMKVRK